MRRIFIIAISLLATCELKAQDAPSAYTLFDDKGHEVSYRSMIEDLSRQDVVFFGEIHNCPVTHWLEYKVLESLHAQWGNDLNIGMEMFEADNQLIIDEYLEGKISGSQFEDECRLWPNYETDYKPLVYFAYEKRLRLIATNVPRRYAGMVKNHGLECLDSVADEARNYMPALPIPYEDNPLANEAFGMMAAVGRNAQVNPEYIGQAQGLKDATMAWFITKNLKKHTIHFNGNYHSDSGEGIIKYLKHYRPGTKIKTIYTVKQEDIKSLDSTYSGHGDYYICIPEDMVTTY